MEAGMLTHDYISQLKEYKEQFVHWWCKPYEVFFKDYDRQNRSLIARLIPVRVDTRESRSKFNLATKQFEKDIRQKHDLIGEIFNFLDVNYDTYLDATDAQRDDIRSLIGDTLYRGPLGLDRYTGNYMALLLLDYVREHVLAEFRTSSHEKWLTCGLVAISMEDCCVDSRDTITCFAKLYGAAKEKNIDPEPAFQRVAAVSSKKLPKGGESSVSSMMAAISEYAATNYRGLFR
jgi:hypothetical protein